MTCVHRALGLGLALTIGGIGYLGVASASDSDQASLESTETLCSNRSLLGTYLFEYVGRPAGDAPYSASGGFRFFDGWGNGWMAFTSVMSAELQTERFEYNIAPDCTGTIDYRSGTTSEHIFVHPRGDHFSWIDTRPGFVANGQDWRASRRGPILCSTATLKGSYVGSSRGNSAPPDTDALYAESWIQSFDGLGRVVGPYTSSDGESNVSIGTYVVNANCVGEIQYPTGAIFRIFVSPAGDALVGVDLVDDFGSLGSSYKVSDQLLFTAD